MGFTNEEKKNLEHSPGLKGLIELEGNHEEFDYNGFHCVINRVKVLGHLCGYVVIPKGHYLYRRSIFTIENNYSIPAHGGITFADFDNEGRYLIGFDCAHGGDALPFMDDGNLPVSLYKNMSYVENNLKEIVDYIKKTNFATNETSQ